jgi:pimeloyl-ACP methyl ester carboxylesterase
MLRKIALGLLALLALVGAALAGWYQVDGQPLPAAREYLAGEGYTAVAEADDALLFTPAAANGRGLLIMHGALIKPLSYAKTAAWFAQRGYTVFVPSGAARLSINAVDDAAARMARLPARDWVMIGHSMGGFSSLELLERHRPNVKAVALWACTMPASYSALTVPMIFLWGDRDGLLPPERFAAAKANLPASVEYVEVPGGNHRGFALYSHQFFDGEATISPVEQIDFANERTAAFFENSGTVH